MNFKPSSHPEADSRPAPEQIWDGCTRFLAGHLRKQPRQVLLELAESLPADEKSDNYGRGRLIESFEEQVAELLGKESAVFMPSGTMCQQIALRLWSERRRTPHVAFHPTCHLEIHEQKGYQLLHGLHGVLIGNPNRLMTLQELQAVPESLAAVLLELPQREIGGHLPAWGELVELTDWARAQEIPVHMDGARLWECQPFYQREYAEIAGLFDTVYVSFYKGLGGLAGAILAGPADFIGEARIWQRRHGGNLIRLYPYLISARHGLAERLPRMQAYHARALELAEWLGSFPQISLSPNPPHTNMMHVFLKGEREKLEPAALEIAKETKTLLFSSLSPTPLPEVHKFELSAGDASLELERQEVVDLFASLFERAAG
jgi:threonine aldolase